MRPKINPFLQKLASSIGSQELTVPTTKAQIDDADSYQTRFDPLGGTNFEAQQDWNDIRYQNQGFWDTMANGAVRALGTAVGSASEIISAPLDLTVAAATGDFANGPVGELFSDMNEYLAEAFPIYYGSQQADESFVESLGKTNFWADKALNGAGYLAGAYFGGKGLGTLFNSIGKGVKAANVASKVGLGTEAAALAKQGSTLAKFSNPAKQLAMAGFMAHGEAAVEARDVRDTMFTDLVAKRDAGDTSLQGKSDEDLMDIAVAAGNTTYAYNLPIIAGSDIALFGKALFPNLRQTRKVLDVTGKVGEATAKESSKLLGIAKDFGKGFVTEGGQELAQLGISEGTKKFYLGQYSNSAKEYGSLISSIVGETINNLGSKEGLESIFLGGILGGPISVLTSERGDSQKAASAYSQFENTAVPNLTRLFQNSAQTATASALQDQYAAKNDKFGFKNEAYNIVKGLTKQAEESGNTDTLISRFEALKGTDVEEFKRVFAYTEELTEQERDEKIDQLVSTIKDVSEKHKSIVDRNPELNPIFNPSKRAVFDAIFDAVTNFEDIDKREREVASDIFKITSNPRFGVGEMLGKEYSSKGVDYNEFRKSDNYKEAFQEELKKNPFKAKELEVLVKDLFSLAKRREEMIKQYNEALEQPEKIEKEAKEAEKEFQEALAKEKEKQAEEATKVITPEEMIGGSPASDFLPVTEEVRQTAKTLDELNEKIANTEAALEQEGLDEDYALTLQADLDELLAQKAVKEIEFEQKQEQEQKEREKESVKEQEKPNIISTKDPITIGKNSFSKLVPSNKKAAQKIIQEVPVKELLAGIKIKKADYTPEKQYEGIRSPKLSYTFEYKGQVLGYLPYYDKFEIEGTKNSWEQLSNEEKLQYFKVDADTNIDEVNLQQQKLKDLWNRLEDLPNGEYTMKDLPFLEITPSLGEFDYKKVGDSMITVEDALKSLPVAIVNGNPVIKDKTTGGFLYDNAPAEDLPKVPKKLDNRYALLIKNGEKYSWIALTPDILSKEAFVEYHKDTLELQKRILEAKKNKIEIPDLQTQLDAVNEATRTKYFTAGDKRNKTYIYANLSNKGTFSLRIVSFAVGQKGGDKTIEANIKTIEEAYEALNNTGAVKGNELPMLLKAEFKNAGLKVNYNEQVDIAEKALETTPIADVLGTAEVSPSIKELRAKEEAEVKKIIPNVEDYKVNGVINKDKVLESIKDEEIKNQYNEIYDRYNKLITGKDTSKSKRFKANKIDLPKDTDNYSVSNTPAEVKIQMDEAIAYLKSIVPFEVADIDSIASRLTNNGITFGAFINNVIYLNKAAKAGTEYHEAFHAVMSLFSAEEKNKYLEVAKKEYKITDKVRAEFLLQRPVYQNLSKEELDKVLLEEYLADKFMAWKQGKKEPNGFLAKMFQKIKDFFNNIKDYFEGNLDSLFSRIDSGKFKNNPISKGNKTPLFMALPYRVEKIAGTNEVSVKKLNSTEETNLINSVRADVAALVVESLETGDVTSIKEAFNKVLAMREVVYSEAVNSSTLDEAFLEEYYNKNVGLFELEGVKEALYEKVKTQVQALLLIDEDISNKISELEETGDLGDFDRNALTNIGIASMSQYVRLLIATAYVEKVDELGVKYKQGLNPSVIYNSIGRTLLNTKPENFMQKLEVFGTYNPEVRDFLTYFKELLNWNEETNSPGLNNKGEIKNEHIWNAFKKGFHKFKVGSIITRLDDKGEVQVSNSNFKDVDTQQVEKWKIGYKNFVEKNYHKIDKDNFDTFQSKNALSDEKLEDTTRLIKNTLDEIGIKLSPLYIKYSILVNKPASTDSQELLMSMYENFNGLNGINNNNMSNLLEFINNGIDPFKEGDEGAMARLKGMAMENASFDETAGSSTFQNAEGELVGDTSLGSFFLKRTAQLQQPEARSEDKKVFEEYYANQEDSWMLPLHFMATQNNPLYEHDVTFDKNFVFSNIDGIRSVSLDKDGKEIDKKEGTVFKNMLPLEKILTFMSLYSTTKTKVTKEGKKVNYAYYYPQVIEAASTGYAILLPVNIFYTEKGLTKEFYNNMLSFVKNEHERIKYVAKTNLPNVRDFNVGKKNGYKFFVNSWLDPVLQAELIAQDNLDNMSDSLKKRLKDNIDKYVADDFKLTLDTLVKEGAVEYKDGEYTSTILPKEFRNGEKVNLDKIRLMQVNYLVNGQALNTLLHGDLAYKVKNPEDHVKRLKGAHGAFTSLYGKQISFKVIPDILTYKEKVVKDGITKFVSTEESKEEHNETDAQAYTNINFQIVRLKELGKFPPSVAKIYNKLKEGQEITRLELDILEKNDALLNPKKDLAYAPNAYLKMSVQTLTRELTSYKVEDEWKALPGREREHNLLDDMEAEDIDLTIYESASKGTTILNEKRFLNGEYYGEQVATKGVKTKITDGTQQLALIWSELPEDVKDLVEQLDAADADRIIQSTEYALSLLKDGDTTTLKKVLPNWYNGLVATGASPQLLDIFKPNAEGEPSLNPNISISVDKFTALYLAHWSNNALKQKVAGAKFTLVSPMQVMESNGKVVRADQFKANPEMNVTPRSLGYNMVGEKDGKKILYSECIVSSYYKELYNLKENDEIPEELAYMLGYRIPTEDKPSMVVLKIVDFMPAIYGNAIMVPEEIQYLSGADFDIDSLFVQKYDMYEKDGKYYKYGTAKSTEGQFEEFINWAKKETDVEAYQKELLDDNKEYQELKALEKNIREQIATKNEKLSELSDYMPISLYEESEKYATTSWVLDTKKALIEQIKDVYNRKKEIEANKLASALRYYGMPGSKTAFAKVYAEGKFKAVLNNDLLSLKIEMLGNPKVQETLASEKTSNEPLLKAEELLKQQFPNTFKTDKSSLGFFSFNDLAVAMSNNDAGKTGIGPAAVFNVVYQYLTKIDAKLNPALQFKIKGELGDTDVNYFQFRGFSYKNTGTYTFPNGKRIVRTISAIISAMTDNAKNPVAAKLNLNTETLGPTLMMIGLGVSGTTALKIVNSKKVKELTTNILKAKSDFIDATPFSIVEDAKSKVDYVKTFGEDASVLNLANLDAYLLDPTNDIADTANIALKIYLNAREASQYMLIAKDMLDLKKGAPSNFSELNKINESYKSLVLNSKISPILGLNKVLDVKPVKALTNALQDLNNTSEDLFISQNPTLKKAYEVVKQQTVGSDRAEVSDKIFKAFNSFASLGIFRQYLEDARAGKTKKYKPRFLNAFLEAFTKEALFEDTLVKEVQDLQKNAKKLGLQNNRFIKYINAQERESKQQVDKIEGNTRQLRDVDYQQELINGFDDLYSNPLTRNTAIKLFAYILLKDGARYRNASFQSEVPAYMFTIYSDALNEFKKNPNFVDTNALGNEFIKVWSLNEENNKTFQFIKTDSDLYDKAEKDGTVTYKEGVYTIDLEKDSGTSIATAYGFKDNVPNAFIKQAKNLMVINKVDEQEVTDLTDIPQGELIEYITAAKKFGVTNLNARGRGVSAYSFPLQEAIELFGKVYKNTKSTVTTETLEDVIAKMDMPTTEDVSNSWIAQQEQEEAKIVSQKEYDAIKETESNVKKQLKEWGVELVIVEDELGFTSTKVVLNNEADERTRNIVEELKADELKIGGNTITENLIFAKLKQADTKETLKKVAEC